MEFKRRTLMQLADMICGNTKPDETAYFRYRSSSYLTEFFADCDSNYVHDGSTRNWWVTEALTKILGEPHPDTRTPPLTFLKVIGTLMDQGDAENEGPDRPAALAALNAALTREGFEAFYATDKKCYLRHLATKTDVLPGSNPHRPFTAAELQRRERLIAYLDQASEDELIAEVLLPLFRQTGFHRVTAAGHKDKALEYGKDVWMKYTLPTQHVSVFWTTSQEGEDRCGRRVEVRNCQYCGDPQSSADDARP